MPGRFDVDLVVHLFWVDLMVEVEEMSRIPLRPQDSDQN